MWLGYVTAIAMIENQFTADCCQQNVWPNDPVDHLRRICCAVAFHRVVLVLTVLVAAPFCPTISSIFFYLPMSLVTCGATGWIERFAVNVKFEWNFFQNGHSSMALGIDGDRANWWKPVNSLHGRIQFAANRMFCESFSIWKDSFQFWIKLQYLNRRLSRWCSDRVRILCVG